jgi:hypothetical protein
MEGRCLTSPTVWSPTRSSSKSCRSDVAWRSVAYWGISSGIWHRDLRGNFISQYLKDCANKISYCNHIRVSLKLLRATKLTHHSTIRKFLHKDVRPVISLTAIILIKHELLIHPGLVIQYLITNLKTHNGNGSASCHFTPRYTPAVHYISTPQTWTRRFIDTVSSEVSTEWNSLLTAFLLQNLATVCHRECLIQICVT